MSNIELRDYLATEGAAATLPLADTDRVIVGQGTNDRIATLANILASARAAGSVSTEMLADLAVTDTKLRNSAALSVIGRSANSTGDPADIAASADFLVLLRSGAALEFGQVATGGIADLAVTEAKLAAAVLSSAWTTLTFATGWTSPVDAGQLPISYKKVGNIVFVSGGAERTTGGNTTIGTLPTGFRPDLNLGLPILSEANATNAVDRGFINASGTIVAPNPLTTGQIVSFSAVFEV